MYGDTKSYVKPCISCHSGNKRGSRTAPMVQRPIVSRPFEVIALDPVGPLPKGWGGDRFLLLAACMATRWHEAVPLRSIISKNVAEAAMVE